MSAGDFQGTYAADKIVVTVGGVICSGFTDGDFVTAEYNNDRYGMMVGADGEVGRSKNPGRDGIITIVLAGSSKANDALSALENLESLSGVDAPIPIGIADLSGRTVIGASKAWLQTAPAVSFGAEITEREWVFACADLQMFVGGNN